MKKYFAQHKHILLFLAVPVYMASFFLVERIIGNDHEFLSVLLPVDRLIPFWEWAVFPYILWYPVMIAMVLYLYFTDARAFTRYILYFIIGFFTTVAFCVIVPNGTAADFRPDTDALGRSNVATWLLNNFIWKNDTYTNVIPSLHVVGTMMVVFGFFDSKLKKNKALGVFVILLSAAIIASTVFVKQHAILDVIVGGVYSAILYVVVYVIIKRRADKKYEKEN